MSTAISPPRCPHRVVNQSAINFLLPFAASLLVLTTTTASLNGRELSDYRLVDPASHMQPWPDDEVDILIKPPASIRIAAKWRTNLSGTRQQTPAPDNPAPDNAVPQVATNQLQDMSTDVTTADITPTDVAPVEAPSKSAEVIAAPVAPTIAAPQMKESAPTSRRDCYQPPRLADLSTSIALPTGKLPTNVATLCAAENPPNDDPRMYGGWPCIEHHWSATCMHHRPLYFEEINAERYGYTVSYALQPMISAVKFFATIPALPYKMTVERPCDCIYTLGHYRPGSCAPRRCNRLPWSFSGAAVETGVIAGLILLIP